MPPFGRLAYMSHMIHKRFMNKHGIELRIISQLSPRSGDKGNTWLTAALANHLLRITWQPFVFQTISMMRNGSIFLHIICRKSPPTAWQSYFLSQLFNLRLLCKFSLNHSLQLATIGLTEFSSPRAESARAVTGRRCPHSGRGGRLFEPSAGFFYGNSCNSGTESRKIVSKVGN